ADRVDGLNLKALECWKTCFRKERKATRKFKHLRRLARAAFEANDLALAEKSAQDVLAAASIEKHSWDFGNAIHHGNIVLGLVALRKNRIPEACNHLLLAGKTCGSPQLNSFGPDFVLAERLLAAGESSCVKEYLTSCRTFWSGHEHIIDEWISLVERGGKPRFNKH
ncbi:MAG: hypothetical protein K2X29_11525, partial [Candidatus Obscuribacterales bacterium]|nr:hypothetical protein [Candidatus Obscuribacterales bacterium]